MPSNTHRALRIIKLASVLARHQLSGNKRQFSQALFESMFDLGGVYVKFLQALIIRSDLFTDQSLAHQIRVYENAQVEPIDIHATLTRELGASWHNQIKSIEDAPFAAGSFGQVYRARLSDNRDVIVKVLRPSLAKTLHFDLRLLGITARIIGLIRPNSMMDLLEVYRDFKDVTVSEISYRREAAFALELYERYQQHPVLTIPYTHLSLCTGSVIVQDYVGGISVSQVLSQPQDPAAYVRAQLGSDLDVQLEEMGYEFLRSMFAYPTAQGDPHPGNIKLLPNNRVGLIDFGMIIESPKDRASLFNLLKQYASIYNGALDVKGLSMALLGMFASKLVDSIHVLGHTTRSAARAHSILAEIATSAEATIQSHRGAEFERLIGSGRFMLAFSQVINEGNHFGLKLHYDATTFIRSSNMFVNLVNSLGRRTVVLRPIYTRAVADIEQNYSHTILSGASVVNQEQAMEVLSDWLDRVAVSDPLLFHKMQHHLTGRRYV